MMPGSWRVIALLRGRLEATPGLGHYRHGSGMTLPTPAYVYFSFQSFLKW